MMDSSAQARRTPGDQPQAQQKPYAVVCLSPESDREQLFLPLTFVYIISGVIHFVMPAESDEFAATVDAVFDELLKGLSLESKGISYLRGCSREQIGNVVNEATVLVTTDVEIEKHAIGNRIPVAMIERAKDEKGPVVRISNLNHLSDLAVRAQLTACARLVNIQSGGYIVGGHFVLSW